MRPDLVVGNPEAVLQPVDQGIELLQLHGSRGLRQGVFTAAIGLSDEVANQTDADVAPVEVRVASVRTLGRDRSSLVHAPRLIDQEVVTQICPAIALLMHALQIAHFPLAAADLVCVGRFSGVVHRDPEGAAHAVVIRQQTLGTPLTARNIDQVVHVARCGAGTGFDGHRGLGVTRNACREAGIGRSDRFALRICDQEFAFFALGAAQVQGSLAQMHQSRARPLVEQVGATQAPCDLSILGLREIAIARGGKGDACLGRFVGLELQLAEADPGFRLIFWAERGQAVLPVFDAFLDRGMRRRRKYRSLERRGPDRSPTRTGGQQGEQSEGRWKSWSGGTRGEHQRQQTTPQEGDFSSAPS